MIFCYSKRVKELQEENTFESIIDYEYVKTYIDNLKELFMEEKNMVGIKSLSFQHFKQLKKLGLKYDQIESIDQNTFTGLDNLEILYLSSNKLVII